MMESLYRKYRPQTFDDVVGQSVIVKTLKNAISSNKLAHAYLFTGSRGTGKTTTARILAKSLLCEHAPTDTPDGTCEECKLIAESRHPDVLELDAASRTGVDNVRDEIISRVKYAPQRGNYKVYIIDEVHMLSTAAFNALLKTLEEPPDKVVFILCTTDPQKVPETIHSRCQRFDFRRISVEEMTAHLGAVCVDENVEFEGEALDLIARRSNGGMRDALSTLEQLIVFGDGNVTLKIAEDLLGSISTNSSIELSVAIVNRDIKSAFSIIRDAVEDGADLAQFSDDVAWIFRDIYVYKLAGESISLNASKPDVGLIEKMSKALSEDRLIYILSGLGDLSKEIKTTSNQQLIFEIALSKLFAPENSITFASLAERISRLEAGGVKVSAENVKINVDAVQTPPVKEAPVKSVSASDVVREEESQAEVTVGSKVSDESLLGAPFTGGYFVSQNGGKVATPQVSQTQVSDASNTSTHATGQTVSPVPSVSSSTETKFSDNHKSTSMETPATPTNGVPAKDKFACDCVKMLGELLVLNRSFFFLIHKDAKFAYDATNNLVKVVLPTNKNFVYGNVNKPAFKERLKTAFGNIGYVGVCVEVVKDDILFDELEAIDTSSINVDGKSNHQMGYDENTSVGAKATSQTVSNDSTTMSSKTVSQKNMSSTSDSAGKPSAPIHNNDSSADNASSFVSTTIPPAPKTIEPTPSVLPTSAPVSPAPQVPQEKAVSVQRDTGANKEIDTVSSIPATDDFDAVPFEVYETQVIDTSFVYDEAGLSFEGSANVPESEANESSNSADVDDIDEMNKLLNAKFGKGISFKYKE